MAAKDPQKSRKARQDDFVMATNNSSIVSKRSVERLYYPEPHFYRYFVKKPLRRAPLINRGYWLRMHAVEQVLNQFLAQSTDNQKIVLNLGCGYDPLAFQWLSKHQPIRNGCRFVDLDFPDLIAKKADVIANTPQLRELIEPLERPSSPGGLAIRSENYLALGCDLGDSNRLDEVLAKSIDRSRSLILCIAEVSITYMDVKAADALIEWAAQYNSIRFCLLEQYLPDGKEHPFAQKMMQHFNNLQTPLKSVQTYPQLADQERRFLGFGWPMVSARCLWDVWNDNTLVSSNQRRSLQDCEPFDEFEEFVLFASHYFLLIADKGFSGPSPMNITSPKGSPGVADYELASRVLTARSEPIPKSSVRRFGALVTISSDALGHHGGLGPQSRIGTMDIYGFHAQAPPTPPDAVGIEPRMCHTISALDNGSLLVGGRTSPEHALRDCWLLQEARWQRVDDLPISLYRHCATRVTLESGCQAVLVYGGKTGNRHVSSCWLLWRASFGWVQVIVQDKELTPRFGAAIVSIGSASGILLGGMTADGTILDDLWEWTLNGEDSIPSIELTKARTSWLGTPNFISRMGACLTRSPIGLLLIGGVSSNFLTQEHEIVCLSQEISHGTQALRWVWKTVICQIIKQRPLLVGHSTHTWKDLVIILGGGAVCFSFGTHWNTELITLSTSNEQGFCAPNHHGPKDETTLPQQNLGDIFTGQLRASEKHQRGFDATTLTGLQLESPEDLTRFIKQGRPVVMPANDLGPCIRQWTLDTLTLKIGADRTVVVHETSNSQMDFQQKNFKYNKKPFRIFVDEITRGSRQYLRSLASESPAENPANFWADFPKLATDFELPPQLDLVKQKIHSSVLRISGPVIMWLHYDVMANVLCQIRGTKRLILYPPSDVSLLYFAPGASSSSINCFDPNLEQYPSLALAHPHEVMLEPGDILYIPPLWLHTASPIDTVSVSVNVFFRSLESGYAPGRDVYGNRDVQAYEKGRKDIERITKSFEKLPSDMARFYMERLADELKAKALHHG